jgi:hypothetical protein
MTASNAIPDRRKLFDLRAIIEFLAESILQQKLTSGESISEIYETIHTILKESKDLSVSGELLATFETNRKVIEEIYNKDGLQSRTLSAPLLSYFDKVVEMKDRLSGEKDALPEVEKPITASLDSFIREYVVIPIKDSRIVFLLLVTVIYRQMQNLSTRGFTEGVKRLAELFNKHSAKADKTISILIYNLCQASVIAIEETDYGRASVFCERAVELFKMMEKGSRIKETIRPQIENAMRITSERLVGRIQEKDEAEQIQIIESLVARLVNIDLKAYLMPKLMFFLIRAQKYEDCMHHLDAILEAEDLSVEFMDYQTAITIGYEWCDSLLKAERYSRGVVEFSFIQKGKEHISKVYELSKSVTVPEIDDETFFNVEIEKLAVTFSHLGTLFFLTGRVETAAESYSRSFETILRKRCSRNRDSVDEVMDRYKDTIHHPLNSAPMEAHALIGTYASEKGYDYLMGLQLQRWDEDGTTYVREEQNFSTLINPQKEMIGDLMDAAMNKLKMRFSEPYVEYKEFIRQKYQELRKRMKLDA